jgi:hypothetical protein
MDPQHCLLSEERILLRKTHKCFSFLCCGFPDQRGSPRGGVCGGFICAAAGVTKYIIYIIRNECIVLNYYMNFNIFHFPCFNQTHNSSIFTRYSSIVQSTRCTCYLKIFILVKRSTCFGRSFRPSSGAQNCVYSNGIQE